MRNTQMKSNMLAFQIISSYCSLIFNQIFDISTLNISIHGVYDSIISEFPFIFYSVLKNMYHAKVHFLIVVEFFRTTINRVESDTSVGENKLLILLYEFVTKKCPK